MPLYAYLIMALTHVCLTVTYNVLFFRPPLYFAVQSNREALPSSENSTMGHCTLKASGGYVGYGYNLLRDRYFNWEYDGGHALAPLGLTMI